jgi:hypothetical protein
MISLSPRLFQGHKKLTLLVSAMLTCHKNVYRQTDVPRDERTEFRLPSAPGNNSPLIQ